MDVSAYGVVAVGEVCCVLSESDGCRVSVCWSDFFCVNSGMFQKHKLYAILLYKILLFLVTTLNPAPAHLAMSKKSLDL